MYIVFYVPICTILIVLMLCQSTTLSQWQKDSEAFLICIIFLTPKIALSLKINVDL